RGDLIQPLALDIGNNRIGGGIADDQEQERTLAGRAFKYPVQEVHRAGRVRKRDKPGVMQRSDKDAGSDADRLDSVVMLHLPAIRQQAITLHEDSNQTGSGFQKRFALVGAKRGQSIKPFSRRTLGVELVLLDLGSLA